MNNYLTQKEKSYKTILWFTDTFEDLNGVASTLREIALYAYTHNYNIHVVTSTHKTPKIPTVYNVDLLFKFVLPYYNTLVIKIPSYKNIKKLLKLNPDKVYISTPGPIGILGKIVAKKAKCKMIGIYHTDFEAQTKYITDNFIATKFMKIYEYLFYKGFDEIKTPSNEYLKKLQDRYSCKISYFERAVDKEMFYYVHKAFNNINIIKNNYNIIYVGRISKDKNIDFIIKVFKKIKDKIENVNLILIGDGPYLKKLKKQYSDKDNIIFTGPIEREELKYYYSFADLFLFPSITDTFGMVIIEALACNCPIIVSNIGGPQEILKSIKLEKNILPIDLSLWYDLSIKILQQRKVKYDKIIYKQYSWENAIKQIIN